MQEACLAIKLILQTEVLVLHTRVVGQLELTVAGANVTSAQAVERNPQLLKRG